MTQAPNPALYSDWPSAKRYEILKNWDNQQVGSHIVSETDRLRVWHLHLEPGERLPFHRHGRDYFWTVLSDGKATSYYEDGTIREAEYKAGDTRHFTIRNGEFFIHDLENTGESALDFVTVEHLDT